MVKNLLKKIINCQDVLQTFFNMSVTWIVGTGANVFFNSALRKNLLGEYNSTNHGIVGVIGGTLAYRKINKGLKGLVTVLGAVTTASLIWEAFENGIVWGDIKGMTSTDTIADFAAVYAGVGLGFLAEKAKEYINNGQAKPKKNAKISMENLMYLDRMRYGENLDKFLETCKRKD